MEINKKLVLISILSAIAILLIAAFLIFPSNKKSEIVKNIPIVSKKDYVKIMFAGDLMFDRGIRFYANKNGGNDYIFAKISNLLNQNDLNVVNLEGPITDYKSVSSGTVAGSANNYYFTFDKNLAKTLYNQNIKLVNLGNNHILNFGRLGLAQTKKYLDEAKVDYFGSPDYPKSISTEIKGIKITFINYNEFANLDKNTNEKSTLEEIQKAKKYSDIIIIFCHWGVEYQKNPTIEQVSLAHKFVDSGADFVVGSHPHVVQTSETYNGKKIYYSLGNFIFDQYFSEDVRNGLGVVLSIDKDTKETTFTEQKFYLQNGGQTIALPKP
jgi:poly-gamma-glutamate synthesis protein (capsule biosynthesis protein)